MRAPSLLICIALVLTAALPSDAQVRGTHPNGASAGRRSERHPAGKRGRQSHPRSPHGKRRPFPGSWRYPGYRYGWPFWPGYYPIPGYPYWGCSYGGRADRDCRAVFPRAIAYPPVYLSDNYGAEEYLAGLLGWSTERPYYDTDPVQFSYTPADVPPRAPVVHPDRAQPSRYSLVLPLKARKPLYALASTSRLTADVSRPLLLVRDAPRDRSHE